MSEKDKKMLEDFIQTQKEIERFNREVLDSIKSSLRDRIKIFKNKEICA